MAPTRPSPPARTSCDLAGPHLALFVFRAPFSQTKADADAERTLQSTTRKSKLAEEYDKKEKQALVDNAV